MFGYIGYYVFVLYESVYYKYIYPKYSDTLTFTTLRANSADDKLMIFFFVFPRKQDLAFHANCLL